MHIKGYYYDGYSSKPNEAKLILDQSKTRILLDSGEEILWANENITLRNLDSLVIYFLHTFDNHEETFEAKLSDKSDLKLVNKLLRPLHKDTFSIAMRQGWGTIAAMALVIVAFIVLFYLFAIPPIAEHMATITPISVETKIGDNLHSQIARMYDDKIDTFRSQKLQAFYDKLVHNSEYHYKFYLINSEEVNAFAIPGGRIYVFSGLLDKMENYEQLSSLLFHEIGHIEKRHTMKNIFRTFSKSIFISLITSDVNAVATLLVENTNAILELSYSKELENEADDYSIAQMKQRNIDLNGFVKLFEILHHQHKGAEPPAILSTHPATRDRIEKGEKARKSQMNIIKAKNMQDAYNQIIGFETRIDNLETENETAE